MVTVSPGPAPTRRRTRRSSGAPPVGRGRAQGRGRGRCVSVTRGRSTSASPGPVSRATSRTPGRESSSSPKTISRARLRTARCCHQRLAQPGKEVALEQVPPGRRPIGCRRSPPEMVSSTGRERSVAARCPPWPPGTSLASGAGAVELRGDRTEAGAELLGDRPGVFAVHLVYHSVCRSRSDKPRQRPGHGLALSGTHHVLVRLVRRAQVDHPVLVPPLTVLLTPHPGNGVPRDDGIRIEHARLPGRPPTRTRTGCPAPDPRRPSGCSVDTDGLANHRDKVRRVRACRPLSGGSPVRSAVVRALTPARSADRPSVPGGLRGVGAPGKTRPEPVEPVPAEHRSYCAGGCGPLPEVAQRPPPRRISAWGEVATLGVRNHCGTAQDVVSRPLLRRPAAHQRSRG